MKTTVGVITTTDNMKLAIGAIKGGFPLTAISRLESAIKHEEAQTVEPIAEVDVASFITWFKDIPPAGTKLFTRPAPAAVPSPSTPLCRNCGGHGWESSVYDGPRPCGFCQPANVTAKQPVSGERDALIAECFERLGGSLAPSNKDFCKRVTDMLAADARTGHHQEPSIHAGCSPIDDNSAQLDCTGIQSGEREVLIAGHRARAESAKLRGPNYSPCISADELLALLDMLAADAQALNQRYADGVAAEMFSTSQQVADPLAEDALKRFGASQYRDGYAQASHDLKAVTQQVVVPQGYVIVPAEVKRLYEFMDTAFTPMTSQQEQIKTSLDLARKAMLAAPQPPQADAPRVPMTDEERRSAWRTSNNCIPSEWPTYLRGLADAESHHGIGVTK